MTFDDLEGSTNDDLCLTHGPGCESTRRYSTPPDVNINGTLVNNNNNNDDDDNGNGIQHVAGNVTSEQHNDWLPYGVAVAAVSLGLLYSYSK